MDDLFEVAVVLYQEMDIMVESFYFHSPLNLKLEGLPPSLLVDCMLSATIIRLISPNIDLSSDHTWEMLIIKAATMLYDVPMLWWCIVAKTDRFILTPSWVSEKPGCYGMML